jgi:hypothetical protein
MLANYSANAWAISQAIVIERLNGAVDTFRLAAASSHHIKILVVQALCCQGTKKKKKEALRKSVSHHVTNCALGK